MLLEVKTFLLILLFVLFVVHKLAIIIKNNLRSTNFDLEFRSSILVIRSYGSPRLQAALQQSLFKYIGYYTDKHIDIIAYEYMTIIPNSELKVGKISRVVLI